MSLQYATFILYKVSIEKEIPPKKKQPKPRLGFNATPTLLDTVVSGLQAASRTTFYLKKNPKLSKKKFALCFGSDRCTTLKIKKNPKLSTL